MSVRRSLIVLALLTVALPVVVFNLRAQQLAADNVDGNLQFYTVERGDLAVAVTLIGAVEAEAVVRPGFTSSGRVAEVLVSPGDHVAAGDVLARLSNDSQRIAYERALLGLQMAELELQDLLSPVDEADIRVAEASINSAWGSYTSLQNVASAQDIQAAELRYQQALDALEEAQHARVIAGNARSPRDYTRLDAQIGEASFNAEIARLRLEALRNGDRGQLNAAYARVVQAQRELDQLLAGPTQAEIDAATVAVEQAQAALDQAESAYNRTILTAPFDGIVSAVEIEVGALVTPGRPVVELTDISPLHLTVQVDEIDIRQINEGMPARVQMDALPGVELSATLADIALVGQNEAGIVSYDARVKLDELNPSVRVGMTAEASVVVDERSAVLVVPNLYVRLDRQADRAFVNVMRADGTLEEDVEITLGLRGQDTSEVLAGLSEGDVLAVDLTGDTISLFGG
jgi:HlyD family secretion protein